MYSRLYVFIEINNILSKNQFGFQRGKSTEHGVLDFHANILQAKKKPASFIFLDVLKAFDTVNRNTSGQTGTLWYKRTLTYFF